MDNLITKIRLGVSLLLVFCLPWFFVSLTGEFYDTNKVYLLYFGVLFSLLLWVIELFFLKRFTVRTSSFDGGLIIFGLALVFNLFFASTNRTEAIFTSGSAGTLIALCGLFFIIRSFPPKQARLHLWGFGAGVGLVALVNLFHILGVIGMLPVAAYVKQNGWTPAGSQLNLMFLTVGIIALVLFELYKSVKQKQMVHIVGLSVFSLILLATLISSMYQIWVVQKVRFMPHSVGWKIALETLKTKPVFGIGSENFLAAYTTSRPIELNRGDLWNVRFLHSSSLIFEMLTVYGIVGVAATLMLGFCAVWDTQKAGRTKKIYYAVLGILSLLFPPTFLLWSLLFISIAAFSTTRSHIDLTISPSWFTRSLLISFLFILLLGLGGVGRAYAAELAFGRSVSEVRQSKAVEAYNAQRQAISLNPYHAGYRLANAQLNLLVGQSIVQGKQELSDQERQTVQARFEQARFEALQAANLSPRSVLVWENVIGVFRGMVGLVKGLEMSLLSAYERAISLDPFNPLLRLEMGQLYFAAGNFDEAMKSFDSAVSLKPDLANAYYNLANVYIAKKDTEKAKQFYKETLRFLPPESADYKKVEAELAALGNAVPATTEQQEFTELNSPQEASPEAMLKQPLDLDDSPVATGSVQSPLPFPSSTP